MSIFNPFRLIQQIRHAYGFSVHSPFAFDLILNTIRSQHSFYIFEENRREIEKIGLMKEADFKYAELLFRLLNKFKAKDILEIGSGFGINTLYIGAHSKQTIVHCVEIDSVKRNISQQLFVNKMRNIMFIDLPISENSIFEAVIWDLGLFPVKSDEIISVIERKIKNDGFIVLKGINTSNNERQIWQKVLKLDRLTMSFDLGTIGLGFFKPSLPKLNYDVFFNHTIERKNVVIARV